MLAHMSILINRVQVFSFLPHPRQHLLFVLFFMTAILSWNFIMVVSPLRYYLKQMQMLWLLFPAFGEHRGPVEDKGSSRKKLHWPEEQRWGCGMERWLGFCSVGWKKLEVKVGLLETWNNWEASIQTTRASLQGKWKAAERWKHHRVHQGARRKSVPNSACSLGTCLSSHPWPVPRKVRNQPVGLCGGG